MADDERDRQVSRPPQRVLNVLCVDGTEGHDSIAFVRLMKWVGRTQGITIRNLLSYLPPFATNQGKDPRKSSEGIAAPASGVVGPTRSVFDPVNQTMTSRALFPFSPAQAAKLPMKHCCRTLKYMKASASQCAFVLLPQGEVKGEVNRFDDAILGTNTTSREQAAKDNSLLMEYLCLAPAVANANTASAKLDFARSTATHQVTDFLYFSGHGGMSGNIVGEDPYFMFFSQLNLARNEFLKISKTSLVAPLWIVMASCFSLRQVHCELWARYFAEQGIPVRGILGYRRTSPLAVHAVIINQRFVLNLKKGRTILDSWQRAHIREKHRDKWTALVFDYAKNDTLVSLAESPNVRQTPTVQEKQQLYFYYGKKTGSLSSREPVKITPPEALLEFHHVKKGGDWRIASDWRKFLITNVDYSEVKLSSYLTTNPGSALKNNHSWREVTGIKRMIDFSPSILNFSPFFYLKEFRISLFPPFKSDFSQGYATGDQIELTVVHVRRDHSKRVRFSELFEVLKVNGQPAAGSNHSIVKGYFYDNFNRRRRSRYLDTIRIGPPQGGSFKPASIEVRFKSNKPKGGYLWFWFGVFVFRGGAEIFHYDFDNFTIAYETDLRYTVWL